MVKNNELIETIILPINYEKFSLSDVENNDVLCPNITLYYEVDGVKNSLKLLKWKLLTNDDFIRYSSFTIVGCDIYPAESTPDGIPRKGLKLRYNNQ